MSADHERHSLFEPQTQTDEPAQGSEVEESFLLRARKQGNHNYVHVQYV